MGRYHLVKSAAVPPCDGIEKCRAYPTEATGSECGLTNSTGAESLPLEIIIGELQTRLQFETFRVTRQSLYLLSRSGPPLTMAPVAAKKRRVEDEVRRPKKKVRKFKKQEQYHSSSEDEDEDEDEDQHTQAEVKARPTSESANDKANRSEQPKPILKATLRAKKSEPADEHVDDDGVDEIERNTALNMAVEDASDEEDDGSGAVLNDGALADRDAENADEDLDDDDEDSDMDLDDTSEAATDSSVARKKRNDPTAFATSISKILTTKLSSQKRTDPILSRSKSASDANKSLADGRLEAKARASMRAERRSLLEKGRVKDVLGLDSAGVDTGAIVEEEHRLKKTAQRGVVKLFNAVRAAQVKAEEAARTAREDGTVGMQKRGERVNEMSKEGFLDLISRGGKASAAP